MVEHAGLTGFLWIGDAIYSGNNTLEGLVAGYENLTASMEYSAFRKSLSFVDGTWDDHDYGVNDGGRDVTEKSERQDLYLDFLFGKGAGGAELRAREGVYHTRDVKLAQNRWLKVVFLDTRYHRGSHYIPSVGEIHLPLTALVAAALRTTYTLLGFGRSHDADVLGAAQWAWLERTLRESNADFHAIVSSIQVLTSNPVVESWGHFPMAKRRLLKLLSDTDPSGPVLLSGDVHHAELSTATVVRGGEATSELMEVTSSGLTHTCGTGRITSFLCPAMLRQFADHRPFEEATFTGKNFGHMELSSDGRALDVTVLDLDTFKPVMQHRVDAHTTLRPGPISDIIYKEFPIDAPFVVKMYSVALLLGIFIFVVLKRLFRRKAPLKGRKSD